MAGTSSYTPTPAGSIASRTLAAITGWLAGTDAPNAANITGGPKGVADLVATLFNRAALLDLGNSFVGVQTYLMTVAGALVAPNVVSGSAPSSTTARFLIAQLDSVAGAGKIRLYLSYQTATKVAIELTVNASWSNSTALWTNDVFLAGNTLGSTRWRFMQSDPNTVTPAAVDTDVKLITAAGQTWNEAGWDIPSTVTAAASFGTIVVKNAHRLPSKEVHLHFVFTATAGVASGTGFVNLTPSSYSHPAAAANYVGLKNGTLAQITITGGVVTTNTALVAGDVITLNALWAAP
jgi:hypothetical protein